MSGGNKGFSELLTEGLENDGGGEDASPSVDIMASRSQTLAKIASGKVVTDRTEFVDPARCKPWRLHNRDLDHLNEESCRDLIDAFLSAKKQRIPAIVRRISGDPDHDFEIVAGVRRWWTVRWLREHHHPEFDYLVTTQRIADEEAFRVSDIENRSRKDISDWERAQEYSRALAEFYDGQQSRMAEHINISRSWLSRLIDVSRLPEEIVVAFIDRHDITVRIARDIKPLLSDPRAHSRMIAEAATIAGERSEAGHALTGVETAKRLIRAAMEPLTRAGRESGIEVRGANGRAVLQYTKTGRGGLTIRILPRGGATREELLEQIGRLL